MVIKMYKITENEVENIGMSTLFCTILKRTKISSISSVIF
ncbi:hypothetical protein HMPREF1143_0546 [Peptoanaerobacter stomatis]|uniref:Uncharacterized protein n=1 Tax=Peptoanaerobacter stomatis TaxID=796937 RepID=G9X1W6_9FIRM|nr:hypothetical protein HMPREF9629_00389 [Peptoanaerobacter stomatis]EJU24026.1 hypothetical protein HMPREF1143_0546 [Peptoanaerobacter stomatis]